MERYQLFFKCRFLRHGEIQRLEDTKKNYRASFEFSGIIFLSCLVYYLFFIVNTVDFLLLLI